MNVMKGLFVLVMIGAAILCAFMDLGPAAKLALTLSAAFGGTGLFIWLVRRKHRSRVKRLRNGGLRFSPVWVASPEHLARVEAIFARYTGGPFAERDLPENLPSLKLLNGFYPVLFQAVGVLDVVDGRVCFRSDESFVDREQYRNISYNVTFEFSIPTPCGKQWVESPVDSKHSTSWLRLAQLDIEPVMLCVGGTNGVESRLLTRELRAVLSGEALPATDDDDPRAA